MHAAPAGQESNLRNCGGLERHLVTCGFLFLRLAVSASGSASASSPMRNMYRFVAFFVALPQTNPSAPRRLVCAIRATIHFLYQDGLHPSITPPCKIHCNNDVYILRYKNYCFKREVVSRKQQHNCQQCKAKTNPHCTAFAFCH